METVESSTGRREKSLGRCVLFADLPASDREALAELVETRAYAAGEILFGEGDPARGFFVVVEGEVKVSRYSAGGREQILHLFGSGEPCGEVPMFRGAPYPATASAVGAAEVLYIPRKGFLELGRRKPDLLFNMLGVLSMRLMHFVNLVDSLALSEVSTRLARHILDLAAREGGVREVRLDSTKAMLASRIGTIAETLSRTLARMQKRGIVRVSGETITILDPALLQQLAEGEKL